MLAFELPQRALHSSRSTFTWGFPKIRGSMLGVPFNKDNRILGVPIL